MTAQMTGQMTAQMRRLLAATGAVVLLSGCGGTPEAETPRTPETTVEGQRVTTGTRLAPRPCPSAVRRSFEPRRVSIEGVGEDLEVVYPPRVSTFVPGTPPLDAAGKQQLAFDRGQGVRAGDARGNVLLNAHTYADGSALGNALLDGLHRGDRLELSAGGQRLCYRVTERVEVDATQPFDRYYDTAGAPQVAIVVCSGERLGPGVWTRRTVWFATPGA